MSFVWAALLKAVASAGAASRDLLADEDDERIWGAEHAVVHAGDEDEDDEEDKEDASIGQLAPSVHAGLAAARVAANEWPCPTVSARTAKAVKRV